MEKTPEQVWRATRKADYKKNKGRMDRQFDALPAIFRERINKFRQNNRNFRWEFEAYELFCCEQAVLIAEGLGKGKNKKELLKVFEEFGRLSWDEQVKKIPGLSTGHSGNMFACSVKLAYLYLTYPEGVIRMHGALAPLVGSSRYGCIPDEDRERKLT